MYSGIPAIPLPRSPGCHYPSFGVGRFAPGSGIDKYELNRRWHYMILNFCSFIYHVWDIEIYVWICNCCDSVIVSLNKQVIEKKESSSCHQWKRNDKGRVVECTECKQRRFCIPCLSKWYNFLLFHLLRSIGLISYLCYWDCANYMFEFRLMKYWSKYVFLLCLVKVS
jgi:hypothetical protein